MRNISIDEINEIFIKYNVSKKNYFFEISEKFTEGNMKRFISELIKEGYTFAIDDFTAGNTSMGYLATIESNIVKLDKSLLDATTINKTRGEKTYSSMSSLLSELDQLVIAEGVETKENSTFLDSTNIDIYQGFLYSRPVEREAFIELIKYS